MQQGMQKKKKKKIFCAFYAFKFQTHVKEWKRLQVLYPVHWVEGKVIACQQAMTDFN